MRDHAREKLTEAVRTLAAGTGSLKERLEQVFLFDLAYLELEHLPRDLRPVYNKIQLWVKGDPDEMVDERAIWNNIRRLSNIQCAEIVLDVVNLTLEMTSRVEPEQVEP